MRSFVLAIGILSLCVTPVESQWGSRGCSPVGRASVIRVAYPSPAPVLVHAPARPAPLIFRDGYPCSTSCTCGCNDDGACPCRGWPAKATVKDLTVAKPKCGCADGCDCRKCSCKSCCKCCDKCPCGSKEDVIADGDPLPKGVLHEQMNRGTDRVWRGSVETTLDEALLAIQSVPDYRAKPRLVCVGTEADCASLRNEAKARGLFADYLWNDYRPDHWHLKDRDGKATYKTDTLPVLYVQEPDGRVLARMDRATVADMGKLRKPLPYDPNKDPDPRKPSLPSLPSVPNLPWSWILAGVGLLTVVIFKLRKS